MQYLVYALLMSPGFILGMMLSYVPFSHMVDRGQKRKLGIVYLLIYCINLAGLAVTFSVFGISMDVVRMDMPIFSLVVMAVNCWLIPGRIREHLLAIGISITCSNLLFGLTLFLSAFIWGEGTLNSYLYGNLVNYVVLIIFSWPLKKLMEKTIRPFLENDADEYWKGVWIIPLAMYFSMFFSASSVEDIDSIRFLLSRAMVALVTLTACHGISQDHKMVQKKKAMEEQLNMQKTHYAQMEDRVNNARKLAHDFKHHLAVIQHFIDTDDRDGLQSYCWELSDRPISGVRIPYTGNGAVDGVLFRYAQLSKDRDVDFTYMGSFGECVMSHMDLSVLIGNALENALTGCMTLAENRCIKVIMQSQKEMISVLVHNTFDGIVRRQGETLYSRKRDNEPGLGMNSMRSICKKYGAEMNVQWDEETFTVLFLIPCEKK